MRTEDGKEEEEGNTKLLDFKNIYACVWVCGWVSLCVDMQEERIKQIGDDRI